MDMKNILVISLVVAMLHSLSSFACDKVACIDLGDSVNIQDPLSELPIQPTTSMLIVEDILPENYSLMNLQATLGSTDINNYEQIKNITEQQLAFEKVNHLMDYWYLQGYFKQKTNIDPKVLISAKVRKNH